MRILLKILTIAAIGLALARRPGGSDSDAPGGINPNRTPSPPPPVGGFNSGRLATKASFDKGEAGGGNGATDSMGHDFELGPDGNPIERGPDGFIIPRDADAIGADDFLPNGSPIFHGETHTRLGTDELTVNNANNVAPIPGVHDIVVHGNPDGSVNVDGNAVNPSQLADAINNNPNYTGGPIRMIVCHSGVSGAGQVVSNLLGVEVQAPNSAVGTNRFLGPGQEPTVMDGAGWTTFYPEE
jgi:hypothetical protein